MRLPRRAVALETSLHERVTHAEEDAAEWKAKFLEVQGFK